ncbi:hypothetical protein TNCV_3482551 [Trichonephila clavipes]|nr:hypothetical protein TNCV_3482551 [Trichonephila clavipes]
MAWKTTSHGKLMILAPVLKSAVDSENDESISKHMKLTTRANADSRCHGHLVFKVIDSRPECHAFESSTHHVGKAMHVKFVEAPTSSRWWGVEVRKRR